MNATVRRLLVVTTLVALSLAPAVLLYLLFGELSTASVERTGVKLGGPVAAFFVALYLLWSIYQKMQKADNPAETRLMPLTGRWRIESRSATSGRKASSQTKMALEGGELQISGGTFFALGVDGRAGDAIGSWTVEMAVSDGRRLKYFYSLTDNLAQHSNWKGLVEVAWQDNASPATLSGTWEVMGKEHHQGTITLVKEG